MLARSNQNSGTDTNLFTSVAWTAQSRPKRAAGEAAHVARAHCLPASWPISKARWLVGLCAASLFGRTVSFFNSCTTTKCGSGESVHLAWSTNTRFAGQAFRNLGWPEASTFSCWDYAGVSLRDFRVVLCSIISPTQAMLGCGLLSKNIILRLASSKQDANPPVHSIIQHGICPILDNYML